MERNIATAWVAPVGARRSSLPLKIAGISCALLAAAILVLSILNVQSMQASSLQSAIIMGRNKLLGDISSFQHTINHQHGKLSLKNGELVDERGHFMQYDYAIVDEISSLMGVQATIFMKEDDDFKRISTSIKYQSGNRAVDTFLGKNSHAYEPVSSGNDYFGDSVIFDIDYLTAYRPLFADNSSEVIGILFIGIEMSSIHDYIKDTTNATINSVLINAAIILAMAILITAVACRIILLKPIRAVMDLLKSIRSGDLDRKLAIHSKDEIGEMVNHINFTVEKVKSMMAAFEHNGILLDTANKATAILLANDDINTFDISLIKCFRLLGQCMDVDRVQIWRNETINNDPGFVLRHEWRSDYGKNCISIPVNKNFLYREKQEWDQKFRRHEYINSPIGKLSEEDRVFFKFCDIKSLVIIPMFLDGVFWGFFSINDCRRERVFSEEEINILSSTGLMLSSAVNRNMQALIAREADERVQLMFNAAPLGASFWDENLNIIDCNDELVRMFELSNKQEFIDRFAEFSPQKQPDGSDSNDLALKNLKEALTKDFSRYEWLYQKLNGELLPCEVIIIRSKNKGKYVLTAYNRDLREQKAILTANEKIKEVNERIQSIFEATPLAITLWDPQTYALLDCNMEAVRLVGLTDKKEYIEKFSEMSPEYQSDGKKTADKFIEVFDLVMNYGSYRHDWDQCSIDGEVIPFQVNTVRLKSIGGYIIISYALDMRETNAAIAKMRKTDEFTQLMFNSMPLACQLWNMEKKCVMCNDEALRIYAAKSRKHLLENFFDYSPPCQQDGRPSKEKGEEFIRKGFEDGYLRFEWTHRRGSGEEFPCEIIMSRTMFNGEPVLLTYTNDLSEQMEIIKERQKFEIAEESNKAKSDFLARMSHEIRTPMNAILGITEIQLLDETHPYHTKEAFERIYNSGGLLLGIINDILDLSKIESGKLVLSPAKYETASLLHDTVQLNTMRYEAKSIEFVLELDENLPALLYGDDLRIKQILNNLLSNAFKYTEKGTVKLAAGVEYANQGDPKNIKLIFTISDTGQGMTPEQVQKLGTEYSRFNTEANRKIEGTGLGMNITRNLIYLMNGAITIESAFGVGSTFRVSLPQENAGSAVIGKEVADNLMKLNLDNSIRLRSSKIKREFMPYGRVLVVDDVETNLYVARGLMAPYGISMETAISGYEVIEKIKSGLTYDIIFMDHMMPRMDGIEAANIIRQFGYKYPIIALTANAITGQAEVFMENGFDDFISKPIDIRQLNEALNKWIRDKQPQKVIETSRKQKEILSSGKSKRKAPDKYLAEIFVRDAEKIIAEMETFFLNKFSEENDLSMFTIEVHSIKSALATIGETALASSASKLEQSGREKNIDLIMAELPSFLETLHSIVDKLAPKKNPGTETENNDDPHYLEEKLLAIKRACALYYKKIAKDTLAELRKKTWPQPTEKQLEKISAHLLHSEFDEVIKEIDSYMNSH